MSALLRSSTARAPCPYPGMVIKAKTTKSKPRVPEQTFLQAIEHRHDCSEKRPKRRWVVQRRIKSLITGVGAQNQTSSGTVCMHVDLTRILPVGPRPSPRCRLDVVNSAVIAYHAVAIGIRISASGRGVEPPNPI